MESVNFLLGLVFGFIAGLEYRRFSALAKFF